MGKYVNGVYVPDPGESDNRNAYSVQDNRNRVEAESAQANDMAVGAERMSRMTQPQAQPAPVQQPNLFAQQKQAYLASPQAQGKQVIPTNANAGSAVTTKPNERMVAVDAFGNPAGLVHGTNAVGVKPIDPNSSTDGVDSILGHFTSPQEEEKYRKASVARQRIMAVGDALRHIGNIYHTTRYAPSQKFNMPAEAERQRYLQEKSLRDQANQRIISYQQAKAAIDQKAKQWEADYGLKVADAARKAGATEAQIKNMQDRLAAQQIQFEANLAYRKANDDANREQRQKQYDTQNALRRQSIGIAATNSRNAEKYRQWKMNGGGGGGKGGTFTVRGKNGFYSKNMSAQELNAFYNQAFEELSNMKVNGKPIIDKQAISGSFIPGLLGGQKINMQARKEAVDKAIAKYPEVGEQYLQSVHEFKFDPRGEQIQTQSMQQMPNIYFSPWNNQQVPNYGSQFTPSNNNDIEDDVDLFDEDMNFSGISI